MILLHQIWNQRRQNLWIFIELLIAGVFLWLVIDPVYVLNANRLIPQGGDSHGVYVLELGEYDESFAGYDSGQDSLAQRHFMDIVRTVRTCPEVEAYALVLYNSFPNAWGWNGMFLYADSVKSVHVQQYAFLAIEGSDLPQTYGMRDVLTGGRIRLPADFRQRDKIAISERTAIDLFGTVDVVGRTVYAGSDLQQPHEVAAVFRNYKHFTSEQPYPLVVMDRKGEWQSPTIVFRLKEGVDTEAFERRFADGVVPHLSQGNYYFVSLDSFAGYSRRMALSAGVTNKLRLQYALAGFALLCIFLGMTGTFYVRANARRSEVGILKAMGASRASIVRRFLAEAWMLVTLAFVPALVVVANYVYVAGLDHGISVVGFITDKLVPDPAYLQNRPVPHFLCVTVLAYVLLLLTALVGTWIPVYRTARILPVDALQEE